MDPTAAGDPLTVLGSIPTFDQIARLAPTATIVMLIVGVTVWMSSRMVRGRVADLKEMIQFLQDWVQRLNDRNQK